MILSLINLEKNKNIKNLFFSIFIKYILTSIINKLTKLMKFLSKVMMIQLKNTNFYLY